MRLNLLEAIKDIIIPPVCTVCSKPCTKPLCGSCRDEIEVLGEGICKGCGKKLEGPLCDFCRYEALPYYKARSFACYSKTLKTILFQYKEEKMYALAGLLGDFLAQSFKLHYRYENIDFVDGLPCRHISTLCGQLESKLKIPYSNNFKKIGPVIKQKSLGAQDRRYNLIGAYKVADSLKFEGKDLLLVDDVFTTGSTLGHIAGLAKAAGAGKVYLLTVARGA